jgi:hypothetical protein
LLSGLQRIAAFEVDRFLLAVGAARHLLALHTDALRMDRAMESPEATLVPTGGAEIFAAGSDPTTVSKLLPGWLIEFLQPAIF